MSPMSTPAADELGRRLLVARFRPLPEVDYDGMLIGTRLWRLHDGHVEYLALRWDGLAHAVRAEAIFDYRRPVEHGMVVGHRFGQAVNALDWLLTTADEPLVRWPRPYVQANPPNPWHEPDQWDSS